MNPVSPKSTFIPADLLYEAIVDSSDDAIVSKDLHSTIMSWNKGAERIFGYSAQEMIGESIVKLLPPDRPNEEAQILARLQRGERVEHFETRRQRKDGRVIHVSLTISPIRTSEGVIVGASKIARDITEQKAALRKLAETHEQLQRADRVKTEFLTTLSHELRTPLNAILGWVQILKDGATEEDIVQGIPIIERNVRVQLQMIEDLLDMSRIEAGKVSLDVQRIVWNLLTNAVKFTPKKGRVHVVIKRIDSHVAIDVTDTGQGIAPEFLGQVFDRFRQADATTTRRHGGLGLGLSIVKHLTELHGGSVQVSSQGPGLGATFTVSLPLQPVRHEPEVEAEARRNAAVDRGAIQVSLGGVKVLAIDDEEDPVGTIRRILERHGAEVRGAYSMEEGLREFTQFAPNVVLSDIGMPEHDGYELITRLRALPGGRTVPAVALTALARSEDRTRALRAGFQLHVAKPVDFTELVAVVQNLASLRAR